MRRQKDPADSEQVNRELAEITDELGPGAGYVFDDLTSMPRLWGPEAALASFLRWCMGIPVGPVAGAASPPYRLARRGARQPIAPAPGLSGETVLILLTTKPVTGWRNPAGEPARALWLVLEA